MEVLFSCEDGVEVVSLTSLDEVERLVCLFEAVAAEEGWVPGGQLRAFAQGSVYLALKQGSALLGGIHLVRPSVAGRLPVHGVWGELEGGTATDAAHVVVLAMRSECRGRPDLFWSLAAEVWRYCWRERIPELWLEVTPRTLRVYRRIGWPVEIAGPLRMHWGEECYPGRVRLMEVACSVLSRAACSDFYRGVVRQACRSDLHGSAVVC